MTHTPPPTHDLREAAELASELSTYATQLIRMETAAGFAGPETSVRVKDPQWLAQLMRRAASALQVRRFAAAEAELATLRAERDEPTDSHARTLAKLTAAEATILSLKAAAARDAEERVRLTTALTEIRNFPREGIYAGGSYKVGWAYDWVQGIARAAIKNSEKTDA